MQELKMGVTSTEEETQAVMKVYSKEDYSVVNRFESHGGGWGYSAHSVEAIRFCADADILLGGLGLFGGRGEYTAKIKVSGRDTSKYTAFPLALFARSIQCLQKIHTGQSPSFLLTSCFKLTSKTLHITAAVWYRASALKFPLLNFSYKSSER
eukprot:XP_014056697.1 PREDICTED: E3 ubiquitin-protein ligase MYCBP2-like [Salmo salar]